MPVSKKTNAQLCVALFMFAITVHGAIINVPADQPTVQAGINVAVSGADEVVVADGTYNEVIDLLGKAITVRSANGPSLTTLDGTALNNSVVRFDAGEGPTTILRGFTITGGTGDGTTFSNTVGGAMFIRNASPIIDTCLLTANTSANWAGGVYCNTANPTFTNCIFENNAAGVRGGGMLGSGSNPTLINCAFVGNTATNDGGGIYNSGGAFTLIQCTFHQNTAGTSGGGVWTSGGNPLVRSCIFWENTDNNGLNTDASAQLHVLSGSPVVTFTCLQGGWTGAGGTGNIASDPLLVAGPDGIVYLSQTASGQATDSPCLDAGCGLASDRYATGTTRTDAVDDAGSIDMGFHFAAGLVTPPPGADLDRDGDVDANDFLTFSNCFNGSLNPPSSGCANCRADLDLDGDADANDFLTFSNCFNGSLNPPACP